jgi:hypothetical protein
VTDEPEPPAPSPITGYRYLCVVTTGPVLLVECASPAELADRLRKEYDQALSSGAAGTRVLALAGVRLPISGTAPRVVRFPDGTELVVTSAPDPSDDTYLLSAADRARLGAAE